MNFPVTRLMPSFFASAVEKVAFAPVSWALTLRSAAGLINTGSTARFRSSAEQWSRSRPG